MARSAVIQREFKRECLVEKYRKKRDMLRKILQDSRISQNDKFTAQIALQKLPKNSAPARLRMRCALTGRPRGVYRRFGICRHMLRQEAMNGNVPGLVKSSW